MANSPAPLSSVPGMPCPTCGFRLVITMDQLLASTPLVCPGCGLQFTVNREESGAALEALRDLDRRLREIGAKE